MSLTPQSQSSASSQPNQEAFQPIVLLHWCDSQTYQQIWYSCRQKRRIKDHRLSWGDSKIWCHETVRTHRRSITFWGKQPFKLDFGAKSSNFLSCFYQIWLVILYMQSLGLQSGVLALSPFIEIGAWNNCPGTLPRWLQSYKTCLKRTWTNSTLNNRSPERSSSLNHHTRWSKEDIHCWCFEKNLTVLFYFLGFSKFKTAGTMHTASDGSRSL